MAGNTPEERGIVPLLYQRWNHVGFLHWPYDPAVVDGLLPDGVQADVIDGAAWISLTPFGITGHRPPGVPALPIVSQFPETNLRTYVRTREGRDGLWFFSLDVASASTTIAARLALGVPYYVARMHINVGEQIEYHGRRLHDPARRHHITLKPGEPLCTPLPLRDSMLVGRWRAYTRHAGQLLEVPVEHPPWSLRKATLLELDESLICAAGLPPPEVEPIVRYSEGVAAKLGVPRFACRHSRSRHAVLGHSSREAGQAPD